MVGGNEPEEQPIAISSFDDALTYIDKFTDEEIDKIIDMVAKKGIDPKYQTGISKFGKREYIRKLFELLSNPILLSKDVSTMEGSGEDDEDDEAPEEPAGKSEFLDGLKDIYEAANNIASKFNTTGKPQYKISETNFYQFTRVGPVLDAVVIDLYKEPKGDIILNKPIDDPDYQSMLDPVKQEFEELKTTVKDFIDKYSTPDKEKLGLFLVRKSVGKTLFTSEQEKVIDALKEHLPLLLNKPVSFFKQEKKTSKGVIEDIEKLLDAQSGVVTYITEKFDFTPMEVLKNITRDVGEINKLLFLKKYNKALFTITLENTLDTTVTINDAEILNELYEAVIQREESVNTLIKQGAWTGAQEFALNYESVNEYIKRRVKILPKNHKVLTWLKVVQSKTFHDRADTYVEGYSVSEGKVCDLDILDRDKPKTWGAGFKPNKLEYMYKQWEKNNDIMVDFFWGVKEKTDILKDKIKKTIGDKSYLKINKLVHSLPPKEFITVPFPKQFFEFFATDPYVAGEFKTKFLATSFLYKEVIQKEYDKNGRETGGSIRYIEPQLDIFIKWFEDNKDKTGGAPLYIKGAFGSSEAIIYNYKHPWCFKYDSDRVYFINAKNGTQLADDEIDFNRLTKLRGFLNFSTKQFGK